MKNSHGLKKKHSKLPAYQHINC